jgi:sterol 3beta-glucosyltransferase
MRIALATVGTTGDVRPFAALGGALVARGHDVTVACWELHRPVFAGVAVRFVACGPTTTDADVRQTAAEATAQRSPLRQVSMLRVFHLREAAEHYAQLRAVFRGHDLVVLHVIHALAEAAARDEGLAYVTAAFDPVLLPTSTAPPAGMPNLGPLNRLAWRALDRALRGEDRVVADALRAAGSPSADAGLRLFRARSSLLHLVAVSPALVPPPADLPNEAHFTGDWRDTQRPPPLPDAVDRFLASGSPPLLVTFGSMAPPDGGLGRLVLDAAQQARQRVVLQDAVTPGADPSADVMRLGRVEHASLLPRVAGMVHHGGAGTTHAAARSGVPQLVMPFVGDQRFWGRRAHRLGLGPPPLEARAATASRLAQRVGLLGDPARYAGATRAIATRMRGEDGVSRAVALIEATATRL